jgi:hypothetical protein
MGRLLEFAARLGTEERCTEHLAGLRSATPAAQPGSAPERSPPAVRSRLRPRSAPAPRRHLTTGWRSGHDAAPGSKPMSPAPMSRSDALTPRTIADAYLCSGFALVSTKLVADTCVAVPAMPR